MKVEHARRYADKDDQMVLSQSDVTTQMLPDQSSTSSLEHNTERFFVKYSKSNSYTYTYSSTDEDEQSLHPKKNLTDSLDNDDIDDDEKWRHNMFFFVDEHEGMEGLNRSAVLEVRRQQRALLKLFGNQEGVRVEILFRVYKLALRRICVAALEASSSSRATDTCRQLLGPRRTRNLAAGRSGRTHDGLSRFREIEPVSGIWGNKMSPREGRATGGQQALFQRQLDRLAEMCKRRQGLDDDDQSGDAIRSELFRVYPGEAVRVLWNRRWMRATVVRAGKRRYTVRIRRPGKGNTLLLKQVPRKMVRYEGSWCHAGSMAVFFRTFVDIADAFEEKSSDNLFQ